MHPYIRFTRPFTLLVPALGIASGSVVAWQEAEHTQSGWLILGRILLGCLIASSLNAASNSLNQIFDLDIDRINKPQRPLPSGQISLPQAWFVTVLLYSLTIGASFLVNLSFAGLVTLAALFTILYSVPPVRTKRHWLLSNLTIAFTRGVLLKVAGWTVLGTITAREPWYIGGIFGLFLLGSMTTKDYADLVGDQAGGCLTLPLRFGITRSAWMTAPFFVLPFLLFPLGVYWNVLRGDAPMLCFLGVSLMVWGSYVVYLILKNPASLTTLENHPSWRQMYLMLIYAQIGLGMAYLV